MPYTKNYNKIKAQQINMDEKGESFVVKTIYGDMEGVDGNFVVVTPENDHNMFVGKVFSKKHIDLLFQKNLKMKKLKKYFQNKIKLKLMV